MQGRRTRNCDANDGFRKLKGGRWTEQEKALFLEAYSLFGKDWKQIKEHVGSRTLD